MPGEFTLPCWRPISPLGDITMSNSSPAFESAARDEFTLLSWRPVSPLVDIRMSKSSITLESAADVMRSTDDNEGNGARHERNSKRRRHIAQGKLV